MLRRLVASLIFALIPTSVVWALPDGSAQTPPYTVTGALLDQVTKSTATVAASKAQGVNGYTMAFHDNRSQFTLPVCFDPTLVEVNGTTIDPASFAMGDTVVISVRANTAATGQSCISRIVRQDIGRGSSGGECLQNFQVKHAIESDPAKLLIKTEYTYLLSVYARPTLDCDAKAYGASPITTVVANGKPFLVTLQRKTNEGVKELIRWSLTTDTAGQARFSYTFLVPDDSYQFKVTPGGNAVAGDVVGWSAKVVDPNPSPSPTPVVADNMPKLTYGPIVALLVIILLGAIGAEYWHWVRKQRAKESPEQEYDRTPKL